MSTIRLLAAFFLAALSQTVHANENKWGVQADLLGHWNEDFGGGVDILVPVTQDDASLLFLDLRGRIEGTSNVFGSTREYGSAGLVYRKLLSSNVFLGAHGSIDYSNTSAGNTFLRAAFGVEALGDNFDFRANGYAPLNSDPKEVLRRMVSTSSFVSGAFVTTTIEQVFLERGLRGVDAEIGWRTPFTKIDDDIQFRLFAGGFVFDQQGVEQFAGPRGRAELRVHNAFGLRNGRLTLGGEFRHDNVRGGNTIVSVRFRIPLTSTGPARRLDRQERRMLDPVQRDWELVSSRLAAPVEE